MRADRRPSPGVIAPDRRALTRRFRLMPSSAAHSARARWTAGSGERASLLDNLRPATTHRTGLLHLGAAYLGGSEREPGVFFACRTRQTDRYWRFVPGPRTGEGKFGETQPEPDALHLRRIDPGNAPGVSEPQLDLEASWRRAAESIVAEHNELADQSRGDAIGPRQKWAVSVLRRPAHGLSAKVVGRAAKALLVGRSNLVRKRLGEIERAFGAKTISLHEAARRIVELVDEEGLREAAPPEPLKRISGEQDLGVVCWMALLPAA